MPEAERVPSGADPTKPNAARVYNYMLGGKDNYEVDQMVAHRMLAVAPDTRTLAWFCRQFLLHSVQLAAEAGVRQFIDIGAGIPISPNVHEVAQQVDASARVVSIDYDPVVYAHGNALLAGVPDEPATSRYRAVTRTWKSAACGSAPARTGYWHC
ncbi:SAM-dependent methyltransferase [Nocardia sp. CWNU-33]|uniref:SAM-dependent methyltransferase n=1 Tax=Nocardia sp. CWNU-33 TaxID=3392117 RepID=UPI00398EC222